MWGPCDVETGNNIWTKCQYIQEGSLYISWKLVGLGRVGVVVDFQMLVFRFWHKLEFLKFLWMC